MYLWDADARTINEIWTANLQYLYTRIYTESYVSVNEYQNAWVILKKNILLGNADYWLHRTSDGTIYFMLHTVYV